MPQYKKDEKGKLMIKPSMLDEWENLEAYIRRIRVEAKDKSKTFKEKVKDTLIKKIREI
jgi:hypothetical protein